MYDLEIYNKEVLPRLESVSMLRNSLRKALKITSLQDSYIGHILLCMTEWLNNIILHSTQPPANIRVNVFSSSGILTIKIIDDASPFSDFSQYVATVGSEENGKFPSASEAGYGLYFIKNFFPNVLYRQICEQGNSYNEFILQQSLSTYDQKSISIAVVEDEPTVANILQAYLRPYYHVEVYFNVEQFLSDLDQKKFSLIISDINFPGMNGIELRKYLAKEKRTDIIPFLFLTGSDDKTIEKQAGDLGIDDFLRKPVTKKQLLDVVNRILTRKSGERSAWGDLLDEEITAILRPQLPHEIVGYECQVAYRHASAGGGDFIVYIPRGDDSLIMLCDVMGHGIKAKFFAHVYAGYIQGIIRSSIKKFNVAAVMQQLSLLIMQDDSLSSVIMTCLAVHLNKSNPGYIEIVNAGHPRPWLITDEGVQEIDVSGILLGIDVTAEYTAYKCRLQNGERLFAFTDGFYEVGVQDAKHSQIKTQMKTWLHHNRQISVAELSNKLMQEFDNYAGVPPQDDATILLLGQEDE